MPSSASRSTSATGWWTSCRRASTARCVGDLPDSSLVSTRLADNRRLCVASPAYLQRAGVPRHPSELARHACLVLQLRRQPDARLGLPHRWRADASAPTGCRVGSTAPTARSCTPGAWRASGWPGAVPGRSRPTCRPAGCSACSMTSPRRQRHLRRLPALTAFAAARAAVGRAPARALRAAELLALSSFDHDGAGPGLARSVAVS